MGTRSGGSWSGAGERAGGRNLKLKLQYSNDFFSLVRGHVPTVRAGLKAVSDEFCVVQSRRPARRFHCAPSSIRSSPLR